MKRAETAENKSFDDVPIGHLHPWPQNPHPPRAKDVREVARSIRRFGFASPIVARRENGEIINGHSRWLAARRLRLETVPVRWSDLPEGEAHMLALADNKIAANRERKWTDEAIAGLLEAAEAAGVDVEVGTGFSEEEIDDLLGGAEDAVEEGGGGSGPGGGDERPGDVFEVLITCESEEQQTELLDRLTSEGLQVRAMVA